MSIDTYYTVLAVAENASQAEIKAAYRELVRQVHPDSVPNASPYWKRAAEEKTKEINEAYSVLSDVKKRREYDRLLAEARQDQEQPQPVVNHSAPPTQQSAPQPQAQPHPTPSRPKRSPFVRTGDTMVLGLFLLFIAAIIFLLLRTTWGALLSSAIFVAVLCWRKLFTMFPLYRRWCVAALVVSVCFVIADLVYPAGESKPTQAVPTGTPAPGPTPVQLRTQDYGANLAVLRNGFSIRFERKEQIGDMTRLYTSSGHIDVPSADIASFEHNDTPNLPPPRSGQQTSLVEVERPHSNAQHLPNGVFSADPMEGYGETKMFMGIECSWRHVDAESKKRWVETGSIPNHTFLISPNNETCYVWDRDVSLFLSKGAVRGEEVVKSNRVVGYKRPAIKQIESADHRVEPTLPASQPLSFQTAKAPAEDRPLPASQQVAPSLSEPERQSIEAACSTAKYVQGPAAYNQCVREQFEMWAAGPRRPDLSKLSSAEVQSIEAACSTAKFVQGPAAYNQCLVRELEHWKAGPVRPDLSSLGFDERQSIEAACSTAKFVQGPGAYNQCLVRQLEMWAAGPKRPDLSSLSFDERQSIEAACSTAKFVQGPAAYNQCLVRQVQSLGGYHR